MALGRWLAIVTACWLAAGAAGSTYNFGISSPRGRVQFRLTRLDDGRLGYAVTLRGRSVIEPSPLGIVVDGVNLSHGVQVDATETYRVRETYPWYGVHSLALNHCQGARVQLRHESSGQAWTLEARAYDDGIAFRFVVPGAKDQVRVPDEATAFRLPSGSVVWFHDFEGHYEGVHKRKAIEEVVAGEWAAPPVTFQLPHGAGYGSITEAALLRYSGMGLQADGHWARGGTRLRIPGRGRLLAKVELCRAPRFHPVFARAGRWDLALEAQQGATRSRGTAAVFPARQRRRGRRSQTGLLRPRGEGSGRALRGFAS